MVTSLWESYLCSQYVSAGNVTHIAMPGEETVLPMLHKALCRHSFHSKVDTTQTNPHYACARPSKAFKAPPRRKAWMELFCCPLLLHYNSSTLRSIQVDQNMSMRQCRVLLQPYDWGEHSPTIVQAPHLQLLTPSCQTAAYVFRHCTLIKACQSKERNVRAAQQYKAHLHGDNGGCVSPVKDYWSHDE